MVVAGIGATWYNVMVNALDANGNNYAALFNSIASGRRHYLCKQKRLFLKI